MAFKETLTPILGSDAEEPKQETSPEFMNMKFEELLENTKVNKQQISILKGKMMVMGDSFMVKSASITGNYVNSTLFDMLSSHDLFHTCKNYGIAGTVTIDAIKTAAKTIREDGAYKYNILHLGFNDMRNYGDIVGVESYISNNLKCLGYYLMCKKRYDLNSVSFGTGWTYADNADDILYTNNYTLSTNKVAFCNTIGAKATLNFNGNHILLGTLSLTALTNGKMTIRVDGVVKYDAKIPKVMTVNTIYGYTPYCILIEGLSDGVHTIEIENSDGDGQIYINYFGTLDEDAITIINGITKMKPEVYAMYSPANKGSDAIVDSINAKIQLDIAGDSRFKYVDLSGFNTTMIGTDNVHPNVYGNAYMKKQLLAVL